ncbi:HDIG domain protein [Clostridiales bacterium oral taxon 876 str. F0540]|nr:HDIG domain protein [Clostridiales bacterium oral taxon 876 str. F0540]
MKVQKTRSVKEASFFGMLGGSLVFALINFMIFFVFVLGLGYMFISSHENNLSEVLIHNLNEKQNRILSISKNLSESMASNIADQQKKMLIENSMKNSTDIQGIFVLDDKGIVKNASDNYNDFLGIDFSGKDYYKQVINANNKKTIISRSYVSQQAKKLTLNAVTPVMKDNKLIGMIVMFINPNIIKNKDISGMEYYLVDNNGDIIFQSDEDNAMSREDNIKNSTILEKGLNKNNAMIYKDKVSGKIVLGIIREEPITSMYIVLEHHILGDKVVLSSLVAMLAVVVLFILIFVLLLSIQVSNVATNYVGMFKDEVKKISQGNYDVKLFNKHPHEEINEIIDSFNNMAQKVRLREEELQTYNEELIAANDEIKTMMAALSKNEKDRKEQYLQIIWTMVNLLEIKDEYTAGHSKSVTYYTEEIVEKLNRDYGFKLDADRIQIAAILHDIGKIGIQREILNKPSRLTQEEYEIIKTHPTKGYYALKDIETLKNEREIIKYHHERYDGRGYPEGIKGDAIPLGARIICVADSFDAMVSDRPYRKGMPVEMAIGELIRNKGTQFDPLIVDVFVAMLRQEQGELFLQQNEA